MNFEDLGTIDWDACESTADWTKLLNDLMGLAQAAAGSAQRDALADRLGEFADRSSSADLDVLTRLDRVARRAARALRLQSIDASIGELQAASAEFRAVVNEILHHVPAMPAVGVRDNPGLAAQARPELGHPVPR